jgi:hypothetical protein
LAASLDRGSASTVGEPREAGPLLSLAEFASLPIGPRQADVSQRKPESKQLTKERDAQTIANYSNPAYVLDWTPEAITAK